MLPERKERNGRRRGGEAGREGEKENKEEGREGREGGKEEKNGGREGERKEGMLLFFLLFSSREDEKCLSAWCGKQLNRIRKVINGKASTIDFLFLLPLQR